GAMKRQREHQREKRTIVWEIIEHVDRAAEQVAIVPAEAGAERAHRQVVLDDEPIQTVAAEKGLAMIAMRRPAVEEQGLVATLFQQTRKSEERSSDLIPHSDALHG